MIGWTVCSGIGAPEVAAPWVDWRLASEIEKFPRAVLQSRLGYVAPAEHNQGEPLLWGDMTEVTPELARSRGVPLPDVMVAGTPCQAFSVAGARKGLADARGNLTLAFVETCHAIVAARPDGRLAVLWENVPGVLSDRGNAFGCFLGGIVGADDALPPPGDGSWPGAGMVSGPRARAAWRVLDTQHFGVPQRRRRVFVVVDFGGSCDPAAVLFERKGVPGDTSAGGETGQVAPTVPARSTGSGGLGTDFDFDGGLTSSTVDTAHCLKAGDFDASEDGTGRGTPLAPVAIQERAGAAEGQVPGGKGWREDGCAYTLEARHHVQSVFDPNQITSRTNRSVPTPGMSHTLPATSQPPIAFSSKDHGADATSDLSPTLRASGHTGSHANAGPPPAVAFQSQASPSQSMNPSQIAPTLDIGKSDGLAVHTPYAVRRLMPVETARLQGFPDDWTAIEYRGKPAADGPQYKSHGNSMAVPVVAWIMRRLTDSMENHGAASSLSLSTATGGGPTRRDASVTAPYSLPGPQRPGFFGGRA